MLEIKPWFWALADRVYRDKCRRVPYDAERDTYECLVLMDAFDAAVESIKSARSKGFNSGNDESIHKHNRAMLSRAGVGRR